MEKEEFAGPCLVMLLPAGPNGVKDTEVGPVAVIEISTPSGKSITPSLLLELLDEELEEELDWLLEELEIELLETELLLELSEELLL